MVGFGLLWVVVYLSMGLVLVVSADFIFLGVVGNVVLGKLLVQVLGVVSCLW